MTSEKTGISAKARKPRFSFLDLAGFAVVLFVLFGGWHYYQRHQTMGHTDQVPGQTYRVTGEMDQLAGERDELAEQIDQMKASFFQSPLPDVRAAEPGKRPGSEVFQHEYEFTTDWVTSKLPAWEKVLAPLKGKPDVQYLEIGVYEGRSAVWMLENILTHPTARLTGVDPFLGDFKDRCFANIERSEASEKVKLITGYSQVVMRELPLDSYDVIYIDGSHHKQDVLEDAVLSWRLLKEGGILIFDDYLFGREPPSKGGEAPTDVPKLAIDPFVHCFDEQLEVLHNSFQLILRKKSKSGARQ